MYYFFFRSVILMEEQKKPGSRFAGYTDTKRRRTSGSSDGNRASSSSVASKYANFSETISSALFWKCNGDTPQKVAKLQWYNLKDLGELSNIDLGFQAPNSTSDSACERFLNNVLKSCKVVMGKSIPLLADSNLSNLLSSKIVFPDLSLYSEEDITAESIVEVHSSLYVYTIWKTIMGATDLLRLRRMYDVDIEIITAFAFPKLPVEGGHEHKQCVVKISVTWKNFKFNYALTPIVKERVVGELEGVVGGFRSLIVGNVFRGNVVIRLSPADLNHFGTGTIQYSSRSGILCKSQGHFYKYPFWESEWSSLSRIASSVALGGIIPVERSTYSRLGMQWSCFVYAALPHDPLKPEEAILCLKQFFVKLCNVLKQLHAKLEVAHMDVRLENICFNQHFEPVLIDLDRSTSIFFPCLGRFLFCESCMYPEDKSIEQIDWVQVGWLVAWVVNTCDGEGYHERKELPESIPGKTILRVLIEEGKCMYVGWYRVHSLCQSLCHSAYQCIELSYMYIVFAIQRLIGPLLQADVPVMSNWRMLI